MNDFLHSLGVNASVRNAVAGDGSGNVRASERGGAQYIYVRLGNANGEVVEARSTILAPYNDDVLYVMLENPAQPRTWRVVFWLRDVTDTTLPPRTGEVPVVAFLVDDDTIHLMDDDNLRLTDDG